MVRIASGLVIVCMEWRLGDVRDTVEIKSKTGKRIIVVAKTSGSVQVLKGR